MKRFLLFLMALLPMMASADDSGKCGENTTYTFVESTNTLTIQGTGATYDFIDENYQLTMPWLSYADKIQTIVVSDGITRISDYTFEGCVNLKRVEIDPNNQFYANWNNDGILYDKYITQLIYAPSGNETINIPAGVLQIRCCQNNQNLTYLDLPCTLKNVIGPAFMGCTNLKTVVIGEVEMPDNDSKFMSYTFKDCPSLSDVYCYAELLPRAENNAFGDSHKQAVLHVKASLIEKYRNQSPWKYFKEIVAIEDNDPKPQHNTFDISYSFDPSSNILTIKGTGPMQENGSYYNRKNPWQDIKCEKLVISEGITTVSDDAFYQQYKLKEISFPNSMTIIRGYNFNNTDVREVVFPDHVNTIEGSSFEACPSLTTVVIGKQIRSIGPLVFDQCKNMTDVFCHAEKVPSTGETAFRGCYNATLHVPAKTVDAYATAIPWKYFSQIVPIENETAIRTASIANQQGTYYDLQGRKISNPKKGLYIFNGKKIIIR